MTRTGLQQDGPRSYESVLQNGDSPPAAGQPKAFCKSALLEGDLPSAAGNRGLPQTRSSGRGFAIHTEGTLHFVSQFSPSINIESGTYEMRYHSTSQLSYQPSFPANQFFHQPILPPTHSPTSQFFRPAQFFHQLTLPPVKFPPLNKTTPKQKTRAPLKTRPSVRSCFC